MRSTEVYRLFIAVELPEDIRIALAAEQDALLAAQLPVRWVASGGIHLTLQFLGNVAAHRPDELLKALQKNVNDLSPFTLHLEGLGAFPDLKRPRVVWVGLVGDLSALKVLHRRVVGAMAHRGFKAEKRAFAPHLTLGRVGREAGPAALVDLGRTLSSRSFCDPREWPVDRLALIRSELLPTGARYTILGHVMLGTRS